MTDDVPPVDVRERTVIDPRMWVGSGKGPLRTLSADWLVERMINWGIRSLTPTDLRRDAPFVGVPGLGSGVHVFRPKKIAEDWWDLLGFRMEIGAPGAGFCFYPRTAKSDTQPGKIPAGKVHIKLPYQIDCYNSLDSMMPAAGAESYILTKQHPVFPGPQHKDVDALRRLLAMRLLYEDVALRLTSIPANQKRRPEVVKHQLVTEQLLVQFRESLFGTFAIDLVAFNFLPPDLWPKLETPSSDTPAPSRPKALKLDGEEVSLEPGNREAALEALIRRYQTEFGCERAVRPQAGLFRREYIAFLVWSKSDRLYAVLDTPVEENAIYIFAVGDTLNANWQPAARRSKSELLSTDRSDTHFLERMYHTANVYQRLAEFFKSH